jgi:NADPH:quinone reductase-like Zn-dependent oxidoreductase
MRAVVISRPGSPDPLDVVDLPDPGEPPAGHVRVRLHGSSLNFHDSLVISDARTRVGHIPLADGAGVVEAVGEEVDGLVVGQRVLAAFFPRWADGRPARDDFPGTPGIGTAGYARRVVVTPAEQFVLAPDGWSHSEAATLTVAGLTAWRAVIDDAAIKPGQVVLVLGTGGVAIYALQFAKMAGATVVVTSSSDAKLDRAKALGADYTVNYRTIRDWGSHIRNLTGGTDLVVELGGAGTLDQSIQASRVGGLISLIGVLDGTAGAVPTGALTMKQLRLHGVVVGSRRHYADMIAAVNTHTIRPVIDHTFALDELPTAVAEFRQSAHVGKVAIAW